MLNMIPAVGYNPRVPGEIYREPEVRASGLIRCDARAIAFVNELRPVFPADNAIDRSNMCWCCQCGWKPKSAFGKDKCRSAKQGKAVLYRLCRGCDKERKRKESEVKRLWKRG